jgi:hypothetical protein
VQQQCIVTGEELGRPHVGRGSRINAAGPYEGERFADTVGQGGIAGALRRCRHEILVPLLHPRQIGESALGERAQQIQGHRGLVVGLEHPRGFRHPRRRGEGVAVDDVAAIGRQGHAIHGFGVR